GREVHTPADDHDEREQTVSERHPPMVGDAALSAADFPRGGAVNQAGRPRPGGPGRVAQLELPSPK
ncbi:MAG: hypothetical protein ACRYG2_02415, partial [Janthinobacterium lividum]